MYLTRLISIHHTLRGHAMRDKIRRVRGISCRENIHFSVHMFASYFDCNTQCTTVSSTWHAARSRRGVNESSCTVSRTFQKYRVELSRDIVAAARGDESTASPFISEIDVVPVAGRAHARGKRIPGLEARRNVAEDTKAIGGGPINVGRTLPSLAVYGNIGRPILRRTGAHDRKRSSATIDTFTPACK